MLTWCVGRSHARLIAFDVHKKGEWKESIHVKHRHNVHSRREGISKVCCLTSKQDQTRNENCLVLPERCPFVCGGARYRSEQINSQLALLVLYETQLNNQDENGRHERLVRLSAIGRLL